MHVTNILKAYILRDDNAAFKLAQEDVKYHKLARGLLEKNLKKIVNDDHKYRLKKLENTSDKLLTLSNMPKQTGDSNISPSVTTEHTEKKLNAFVNNDNFLISIVEKAINNCNNLLSKADNQQNRDKEPYAFINDFRKIVTNLATFAKVEDTKTPGIATIADDLLKKEIVSERSFTSYGDRQLSSQDKPKEWQALQAHVEDVKSWCESLKETFNKQREKSS